MAPHQGVDNHRSVPSKPSPLSAKHNAGKSAPAPPAAPYKRDLQSAMHNAPQVRVIHIFAPKVIKTDVANFRATVQKLTGRSKRRTPRVAKAINDSCVPVTNSADGLQTMAQGTGAVQTSPSSMGYPVGLWEKEELQRLVGDACGVTDLVRCDSVDSGNYSLDSGNTVFSGDSSGVDTSPTSDSFSFYPQRESPYSLSEIPAPFFGLQPHDMHSVFNPTISMPMSMPMSGSVGLLPDHSLMGLPTSHVMDHQNMSMMGFDVDSVGGALPLPALPALPDVLPLGCSSITSSSSGGSLFDLPRQHCRLSVHQQYQGF
ncbi:hypothetical protein M758_10G151000 [Ceratodon purpureus]|uniref:VQ domain-containing protein n=1 Tax=Ceratodon purpureus TaxID=3225 RepID=A0A8T0GNG0_CERPU|nr:hypothetical protein KC19_10G156100 [Ceratodon purpureus]KAG0560124.1 hypothetical protein KC19_10G156100 [Ceratodon purpureus]KAG0560127.1 hypothetical protein KC19_10G156100 [Ceratodon purpureus]KAG0604177.1 hypothetical protein M758_10G151000 [Ceratodon purpureus]KAG0604180.1 hypothetical protein M758_10G151000 [Ceratodon purpureus]